MQCASSTASSEISSSCALAQEPSVSSRFGAYKILYIAPERVSR